MGDFKKYKRSQIAELREVTVGDLYRFANYGCIEYSWTGKISISQADLENASPKIGDMIGRNPKNHLDQWLIAEQYFKDNFESAEIESGDDGSVAEELFSGVNSLEEKCLAVQESLKGKYFNLYEALENYGVSEVDYIRFREKE